MLLPALAQKSALKLKVARSSETPVNFCQTIPRHNRHNQADCIFTITAMRTSNLAKGTYIYVEKWVEFVLAILDV
jgi:hypothetical protein